MHRHGRLTRLYTADEMTIDPVFVEDDGVPEVSKVHRATLVTERSDQYYEDEAPTHWELGDVETALRPGTPADPWAYCARFGAMPDDGRDPPPRSSGRLCGVVGGGSIQWAALALVAVIALARRRRRGHRS